MNDRQTTEIATALATINGMREQIDHLIDQNAQLKADIHHLESRCNLLDEERKTWRTDATILRSRLIELATIQTNIGLLTRSADEIATAAQTLLSGEAKTQVLDSLERELSGTRVPGNAFTTNGEEQLADTLEAVRPGTSALAG